MQKTLRIRFDRLPPRPRAVSAEDVSRIFGGCLTRGYTCRAPEDCCPSLACQQAYMERRCL
jgi:hypothetical protein